MPLAGEHIAVGVLIYSSSQGFDENKWPWQILTVAVLANAPDLDVIPGIILQNDWGYYHRLATHSLLYSIVFGILATWIVNEITKRKLICPWASTAVVFSHVVADYLLSPWPVQFCWPVNTTLYLSHYPLLEYFNLLNPTNRAWFIYLSCLIVYSCLMWRKQLAMVQSDKLLKWMSISHRTSAEVKVYN